MFTKTAKSEVYKNLRKFLEIYKNYKTEVYKNHPKNEVYKNRIFFEIYKFTRVKFTKTALPQKRVTSVDFQSNLRKQIRKSPKFLRLVNQFFNFIQSCPQLRHNTRCTPADVRASAVQGSAFSPLPRRTSCRWTLSESPSTASFDSPVYARSLQMFGQKRENLVKIVDSVNHLLVEPHFPIEILNKNV